MKGTLQPLTRKLLLSLASAAVAFLICEIALRAVGYNYSPLHINANAIEHDHRIHHVFEDRHFRIDPVLLWRPKEDYPPFNSQGFRGNELAEKKAPGEFRIFALGDSNTLGWQDSDERPGANWPRFLEELLHSSGKGCTVTNAGVWGYSSYQGRERFRQILSYQPDLVLVSFGGNDAHKVALSDADYARRGLNSLVMHFRVGQLTWATWEQLRPGQWATRDEDLVFRVSPERYRENLDEIIRLAGENGVRCVLLTRPFADTSTDARCWMTYAPQYVTATLDVGRAHGVPVVDLCASFKDRKEFFVDESHFTEAGHRLAARRIYAAIQPLLPQ